MSKKRRILKYCLIGILVLIIAAGIYIWNFVIPTPTISSYDIGTPENVKIITTDYDAFWNAYEKSVQNQRTPNDTIDEDLFYKTYKASVTGELDSFSERRYGDAQAVYQTAEMAPFYASYREVYPIDSVYKRDEIIAGYKKVRTYMPQAKLPDIHIFIGRIDNGGTITENKIIIAHEVFVPVKLANWDLYPNPERVVRQKKYFQNRIADVESIDTTQLIMHELMHYIQATQRLNKSSIAWIKWQMIKSIINLGEYATSLFFYSMVEGIAEFLASHITGKRSAVFLAQDKWVEDNNMEERLWNEFSANRNSTDRKVISRWLYNSDVEDRPSDLGYWMGLKIAETYWQKQTDKKQAFDNLVHATVLSKMEEIYTVADFGAKY